MHACMTRVIEEPDMLDCTIGVPSCFLVNRGKIVWSGHPTELDVCASIEAVLAGNAPVLAGTHDPAAGLSALPTLASLSESAMLDLIDGIQGAVAALDAEAYAGIQVVCQVRAVFQGSDVTRTRHVVFQGRANKKHVCVRVHVR